MPTDALSDPRSAEAVHVFSRAKRSADDSPIDYFSILAVLTGSACMFYEVCSSASQVKYTIIYIHIIYRAVVM